MYRITHRPTMASTDVAWVATHGGTRLTLNTHAEAVEYVETQMVSRPDLWPGNIAIERRDGNVWMRVDAWSCRALWDGVDENIARA